MDLPFICLMFLGLLYPVESRVVAPGKCTIHWPLRMKGADCVNLNLVTIPNITSVEVLDASVNRIRVLKNDSFLHLTELKFLYLTDNAITIIEEAAFEPLEDLEVLELSLNSIRNLPALLPSTLRKLHMNENPLEIIPLGNAISLQDLSLAYCYLTTLPDVGILPQLIKLNITGNPLDFIYVEQIASLCHLKYLYLPDTLTHSRYTTNCECVRVSTWTLRNAITVFPELNCTVMNETDCILNSSPNATEAFSSCQLVYQQISSPRWMVGLVIALVVSILAVVLILLWRRRWRRPPVPPPQPSQEEVRKRKLLEKTHHPKSSIKF